MDKSFAAFLWRWLRSRRSSATSCCLAVFAILCSCLSGHMDTPDQISVDDQQARARQEDFLRKVSFLFECLVDTGPPGYSEGAAGEREYARETVAFTELRKLSASIPTKYLISKLSDMRPVHLKTSLLMAFIDPPAHPPLSDDLAESNLEETGPRQKNEEEDPSEFFRPIFPLTRSRAADKLCDVAAFLLNGRLPSYFLFHSSHSPEVRQRIIQYARELAKPAPHPIPIHYELPKALNNSMSKVLSPRHDFMRGFSRAVRG